MKNKSFVLAMAILLLGGTGLSAQSLMIGPGIAFEKDRELEGGHLRVYYSAPKWFSFGPEITYYVPSRFSGKDANDNDVLREERYWSADFNLHIDFKICKLLTLYPLVGANYTRLYTYDGPATPEGEPREIPFQDNRIGINAGAGIHLFPNRMGPFFEYKKVWGTFDQTVLTMGLNFRIPFKDHQDWVPERSAMRFKTKGKD